MQPACIWVTRESGSFLEDSYNGVQKALERGKGGAGVEQQMSLASPFFTVFYSSFPFAAVCPQLVPRGRAGMQAGDVQKQERCQVKRRSRGTAPSSCPIPGRAERDRLLYGLLFLF